MIIGSGMGGLRMVELLGILEVLRFIIFTSWTSVISIPMGRRCYSLESS